MKLKFWKSREKKESRVSSAIAGLFGGGVAWSERDYENFAKEVYLKNIIGYRCIDIIAKAVSSVPWDIFLVSEDDEKEHINHPISNRLKRANPEESWSFLIYSSVSYLLLSGNSFLEKVTLSGGNDEKVEELYNLRPDRMQILVDENTGIKKGYKYTAAGTPVIFDIDPITRESPVLHIHLFHPTDDFWGASIVEPAAWTIDTSNAATKWNKKLLDNEARPGMLLMFKELLGDKQFDRLSKQIREAREGAENAGKSLILEGATEAKPYGFNPAEMDFIKGNLELSRNICNAWGVPPQLVGIPDTNTYSNYREARAALWEDTIIFYLTLYQGEFNNWFFGEESNIEINYMLDDVPALSYKRDKMWERAQQADFLSINEKRAMVQMESIEGGDVVLVPASMIPLGAELPTEEEIEEDDEKAIKDLINEGIGREEAEEMISG